MNSAIGPYKGGVALSPTVSAASEIFGVRAGLQEFVDHAAMGGGKGGSDFDPKGKSDNEVMRSASRS